MCGYEDDQEDRANEIEYVEDISKCTICKKKKIGNDCQKIHIELDSMRTFTHYTCNSCFINLLGALERTTHDITNIQQEYTKYWNDYAIKKHDLKQKKSWF